MKSNEARQLTNAYKNKTAVEITLELVKQAAQSGKDELLFLNTFKEDQEKILYELGYKITVEKDGFIFKETYTRLSW